MRRHSPPYRSPPRRGYSSRGRSPPRRSHGGRKDHGNGSLLVRNIPLSCRSEDLRVPFERFGPVRDVYLPKDYYSGEPRGFAFVEFVDPYDASEAQYRMNGQRFGGRVLTVVLAAETRKRPDEMRSRDGHRGHSSRSVRRYYERSRSRSRSRSWSRSHSPHHPSSNGRDRNRSRSRSSAPKHRDDYSASPPRGRSGHARSPSDHSGRRGESLDRRSRSPSHTVAKRSHSDADYNRKVSHDAESSRSPTLSPR